MTKSATTNEHAAQIRRLCCNRNTARLVHDLALRGMTLPEPVSKFMISHDAAQRHLNRNAGEIAPT